ncbi:hypothetical protein jhhlp_001926 [Lomentospora prolificans]|uniref:VPS9 domain-containing protein n=1 Tax=Lomentospora prolificans TaxID=41688 RepID=A0A2N3NCI5_9PEZI|nr:hypothetical protein jhhlp_001926 [Lomentospora prolificans]
MSSTITPSSRPGPLRAAASAKNASKDGPSSVNPLRRANTFQNGTTPNSRSQTTSVFNPAEGPLTSPDALETTDNDEAGEAGRVSVDMGEMPIELVSLTDSFIESLSAKVHPTPPNIDNLARLFQDFYAVASTHINTHISTLAMKQTRDASPAPSRQSTAQRLRAKAASIGSKDKPKELDQQMLTAGELAERKRARKALELKRGRLEEAVERRLCEGIYARIYRHRSTQDEAQDDKLRSKTAALALVGINLGDLGIEFGDSSKDGENEEDSKAEVIKEALEPARQELIRMNEARYPLGKLNHLKAVHKAIVDVLSQYQPSASADEIMPMIIYTLITLPPEKLNVISDTHFIQNFRWEQKLNGEAAYCLTTLEAAISFLETVDLSTLRADELPSGPPKLVSQPGTPRVETFPPAYAPGLSSATGSQPEATLANATGATGAKPPPSPGGLRAAVQKNRRLSDLVNTPAQAINAASDSIFTTADQGLKTISNSLGDSYNFLVGKLRERQETPETGKDLVVPKTLDDARKLVSTPPPEDDGSVSGASSIHGPEEGRSPPREDKVLNLIGGRKPIRDHSADSLRSLRSASSSKKATSAVAAQVEGIPEEGAREKVPPPQPSPSPSVNPALVESMRNLGSSLNPIGRLSSIGMIRGFGRPAPTPPPKDGAATKGPTEGGDLATAFPDLATALPPKATPKIPPPNKRFMELQSPGDLKLGEVLDLLRDYRRLANALKDLDAFESK